MRTAAPATPYSLIPFEGVEDDRLLAGLTPPRDAGGETVDVGQVVEELPRLLDAAGGRHWAPRWVHQVHGTTLVEVDAATDLQGTRDADGLITSEPGVLLITRHADCPPVLIWDPVMPTVALLHSGRRGTLADIAGTAVSHLRVRFGADPAELVASLGPGIRQCCYELGEDALGTPSEREAAMPFLRTEGDRYFLDMHAMIASQLRASGVSLIHGERTAECTACGPSRLHSYRRDGTMRRSVALAGIRP